MGSLPETLHTQAEPRRDEHRALLDWASCKKNSLSPASIVTPPGCNQACSASNAEGEDIASWW